MKHINYLVLSALAMFFTSFAYAQVNDKATNSYPTWVYWLVGIIIALAFTIYVKFKK